MSQVPGQLPDLRNYSIRDVQSGDTFVEVFRGTPTTDSSPILNRGKSVLIQVAHIPFPSKTELVRFKWLQDKFKSIEHPSVLQPLEILSDSKQTTVISEIFEGVTLKDWLKRIRLKGRFPVESALKLAIQITDALDKIHASGLIAGALSPSSILVQLEQDHIKLTHFGLTELAIASHKLLYAAPLLRNWLPYIAPEQSGRMNRVVDSRSDLYALGILLYEMLVGNPPFESNDPLKLIHQHIAQLPTSPMERNPSIPQHLNDIILLLLSKNAEERYQTAHGLKLDLEHIAKLLKSGEKFDGFELRKNDFSASFAVPQKLYGRTAELDSLLSSLQQANQGRPQIALVSGEPGVGKSTLVRELNKYILEDRGYFLMGKHDQYIKDRPYYAINQLFEGIIAQILSESNDIVQMWKQKILQALGSNPQVIVEIIPKLELIIGKQPPVPDLGPTESQNRLHLTYQKFIDVFAQQDHPLTFYLDDLQWADTASLNLVQSLLTDRSHQRYLFFIGAYRSNEVGSAHPLAVMLEQISAEGIEISKLHLKALRSTDVQDIVNDVLDTNTEKSGPLAELIYRKTEGNPLFVSQFLRSIYDDRILIYEAKEGWTWNMARVNALEASDSVVQLILRRIGKVPPWINEILRIASCIGNIFQFDLLCRLISQDSTSVLTALQNAANYGIILQPSLTGTRDSFFFLHDRVHDAIYSSIPNQQKEQIHASIARSILKAVQESRAENALEDQLFNIVNQFNLSGPTILDQSELLTQLQLNFQAGKRAKHSNAYQSASIYLDMASAIRTRLAQPLEPDFDFHLSHELAECTYLAGDLKKAEALFDDCINKKALTKHHRAQVYNTKTVMLNHHGNYAEALANGIAGLALFGIAVEARPSTLSLVLLIFELKLKMSTRKVSDLIHLPPATDLDTEWTMILACSASNVAYLLLNVNRNLFPYLCLTMMKVSLLHGNAKTSCIGYLGYGLVLAGGFSDYETSLEFGTLAIQLAERAQKFELKGQLATAFYASIAGWKMTFRHCIEKLVQANHLALEAGDFLYASYSLSARNNLMLFTGYNLNQVIQNCTEHIEFAKRHKCTEVYYIDRIYLHFALSLTGHTESASSFNTRNFREETIIKEIETDRSLSRIPAFCFNLAKLTSLFIFDQTLEAKKYSDRAAIYLDAVPGTIMVGEYSFYSLVVEINFYSSSRGLTRLKSWLAVQWKLRQLRAIVKGCPENFMHLYLFAKAKLLHSQNKWRHAIQTYSECINSAAVPGARHIQAFAHEQLATILLKMHSEVSVRAHAEEAIKLYRDWGAVAKVKILEKRFAQYLSKSSPTQLSGTDASETTHSGLVVSDLQAAQNPLSHLSVLDLVSLLKSSQILSEEITLSKLLGRLMKITLETAGAQRGLLFLEKEGSLTVAVNQDAPSEQPREASQGVIQYARRTQQSVVLSASDRYGTFASDPYLLKYQPKSVLALPILKSNGFLGILYLENNIASDAFTEGRLEILRHLAVQGAISLENALLYSEMQEKIRESTRDIHSIMENIQYGIFTFGEERFIYPDYSKHLHSIFNSEQLAGLSFEKILFHNCTLSADQMDQMNQAIETVWDADRFQFEVNRGLLPKEIRREVTHTSIPSADQILELDWVPIESSDLNGNLVVKKIMVTVRDVTELRKAEREARQTAAELRMIGQLIQVDPERIDTFFRNSYVTLNQIEEELKLIAGSDANEEDRMKRVTVIFRGLHTLKGNCRTLGFSDITPLVHNAEQFFSNYLKSPKSVRWDFKLQFEQVHEIESAIRHYDSLNESKLGGRRSQSADPSRRQNHAKPLSAILEPILANVPRIAKQLKKPCPKVSVQGELLIAKDFSSDLENIFTHLINNAVDHGVSKTEPGLISIEMKSHLDGHSIFIEDSGKGLNLSKLRAVSGLRLTGSDEEISKEISKKIFEPGVTTAETVTDISGRGIGLEAVRHMVEAIGGRIELEYTANQDPDGFRKFRIKLSLPSKVSEVNAALAA